MAQVILRLLLLVMGAGSGVAATGAGPDAVGYVGGLAGLLAGLALPEPQKKWIRVALYALGAGLGAATELDLIPVPLLGIATGVAGALISVNLKPGPSLVQTLKSAVPLLFCAFVFSCAGNDALRVAVGVNNVAVSAINESAFLIEAHAHEDELDALLDGEQTRGAANARVTAVRVKWDQIRLRHDQARAAANVFADAITAAHAAGTSGVSVKTSSALLSTWTSLAQALRTAGVEFPSPPEELKQLIGTVVQ